MRGLFIGSEPQPCGCCVTKTRGAIKTQGHEDKQWRGHEIVVNGPTAKDFSKSYYYIVLTVAYTHTFAHTSQ